MNSDENCDGKMTQQTRSFYSLSFHSNFILKQLKGACVTLIEQVIMTYLYDIVLTA